MAKIRPAKKNAAKQQPSVADWSKAVPCLFILVAGFVILAVIMYYGVTTSVK
jgi:hypothetical protein